MTALERVVVWGEHTPSATAAVRWAVTEAEQAGAAVVVVRPFDVAARADLGLERDLERARRDSRFRAQSWVVEAAADLSTSVPVVVSTPDGSAYDALAAAARDARMLVIGDHEGNHRDLAERLARACTCPVVMVTRDQVPTQFERC
jgi:hypothetical protein